MDSLNWNVKFTKEKLNRKSLVVFSNEWLSIFALLCCLNSDCVALNIKGRLNKDVILPCIVKYKDKFSYSQLVVNWQRSENDSVVHSFYYGSSQPSHQHASYQGRTHIFEELLPEGNASLLLRSLTTSDAGLYTCHVILTEVTGYTSQQLNLTVEDVSELIYRERLWTLWILVQLLIILLWALYFYNQHRNSKYEQIIKKYRDFLKQNITATHGTAFLRQLLVPEYRHFSTSDLNFKFGEKNLLVDASELFTPGNKHLKSKRMLLLGNAGTGKSYLCKWLEDRWMREEEMLYECIIYVSCKRINTKKLTSVEKIVEENYNELPKILHMSEVLLILDDLDNLSYGEKNVSGYDVDGIEAEPEKKELLNTGVHLELETLVKNIIMEKLLPETDVLIVSRHGSAINKLRKCRTFILQDLKDASIDESKTKWSQSITNISQNPAFVVMMPNLDKNLEKPFEEYTSPYELLTSHLRQCLRNFKTEANKFLQLASQSYENLVKGQENEETELWKHVLNIFHCNTDLKYQCNILRDMLAALHCSWEIRKGETLRDCLDFWVYGSHTQRNSVLLKHAAKEHNTKYYNFIRFFMRLLPFSSYDNLCRGAPDMDDNMVNEIADFFQTKIKDCIDNHRNLQLIHCVFELHDEHVTNQLSASLKKFSLLNTPLNSLDIRALAYFLRNGKLEELDLRLCELTDKDVQKLDNVIRNTRYVLLSSNNLTASTGQFLAGVLSNADCCIEKLALGTNNLGPDGGQCLWRSLQLNTSLKELYLYDNNIGDEGTKGIVEHLQKNNSLTELHFCLNVFSKKGIENIQTLKQQKPDLHIVMRISEDLGLFEFAEKSVEDLKDTHMNYDQEWLIRLLEAVRADLEGSSCEAKIQQRVEAVVQQISDIIKKSGVKNERITRRLKQINCLDV